MAHGSGKARRGADGLTPKQRAFVEAYLANGGNGTRAAFVAYNCKNARSADGCARAALRDANVQRVLCSLLSRSEIDAYTLAVKIREGLDAMKLCGGTDVWVPDWDVRFRYLRTVLALMAEKDENYLAM